ncbi:MAG: hypothetical protein GY868_12925 [Deltaproteobacteria bacterium]|nr:hypothetical protein [Deltaproteobacteria bacterium]
MEIGTAVNPVLLTNKPMGSASRTIAAPDAKELQLREKCNEFQSLLYNCMLKSMRNTIDKNELFHGGQAEEMYTSMLDMEYAKMMSQGTKSGVAEALYSQLSKK